MKVINKGFIIIFISIILMLLAGGIELMISQNTAVKYLSNQQKLDQDLDVLKYDIESRLSDFKICSKSFNSLVIDPATASTIPINVTISDYGTTPTPAFTPNSNYRKLKINSINFLITQFAPNKNYTIKLGSTVDLNILVTSLANPSLKKSIKIPVDITLLEGVNNKYYVTGCSSHSENQRNGPSIYTCKDTQLLIGFSGKRSAFCIDKNRKSFSSISQLKNFCYQSNSHLCNVSELQTACIDSLYASNVHTFKLWGLNITGTFYIGEQPDATSESGAKVNITNYPCEFMTSSNILFNFQGFCCETL